MHRSEVSLAQAAATVGCELELHTGQMVGRRAQGLAAMINRVDLVIILTDVNSHNAVLAARRLAGSRGCRHILLRRCSPARLVELVRSMSASEPLPAA